MAKRLKIPRDTKASRLLAPSKGKKTSVASEGKKASVAPADKKGRVALKGKKVRVVSKGKKSSGALVWEILNPKGFAPTVVVTSASSAATIQEIKKKHSKALKRLAKK